MASGCPPAPHRPPVPREVPGKLRRCRARSGRRGGQEGQEPRGSEAPEARLSAARGGTLELLALTRPPPGQLQAAEASSLPAPEAGRRLRSQRPRGRARSRGPAGGPGSLPLTPTPQGLLPACLPSSPTGTPARRTGPTRTHSPIRRSRAGGKRQTFSQTAAQLSAQRGSQSPRLRLSPPRGIQSVLRFTRQAAATHPGTRRPCTEEPAGPWAVNPFEAPSPGLVTASACDSLRVRTRLTAGTFRRGPPQHVPARATRSLLTGPSGALGVLVPGVLLQL